MFKDVGFFSRSKYSKWKAVVHLKCDPSGSQNEGDFYFLGTENNEWVRDTTNSDLML